MDEQTNSEQTPKDEVQPPEERPDEDLIGADGDPVGANNIRDGEVRGTMHGGPTASQGQGQGG